MNFLSWLNFQRFFTQDFAAVQESIPAQVKKTSKFLAGTLLPVSIYKIPHVWADCTMMTTDDVALTTLNDCDDDRDPWGLRLIEFYSPHRVIQSDPHFCSVLCMRKYNDDTVTPRIYLPLRKICELSCGCRYTCADGYDGNGGVWWLQQSVIIILPFIFRQLWANYTREFAQFFGKGKRKKVWREISDFLIFISIFSPRWNQATPTSRHDDDLKRRREWY